MCFYGSFNVQNYNGTNIVRRYANCKHVRNLQIEMRDKNQYANRFFSFSSYFIEPNIDMKEIENERHAYRRDIIIILCAYVASRAIKIKVAVSSSK